MIGIDRPRTARDLCRRSNTCSPCRGKSALERRWRPSDGAPRIHVGAATRPAAGRNGPGLPVGSTILQFDATGDRAFLDLGRSRTVERMAPHVSHSGVHDHGFNKAQPTAHCGGSTRGPDRVRRVGAHVLRAGAEGQRRVQASRWTTRFQAADSSTRSTARESLFVDTIRCCERSHLPTVASSDADR